MNEIMCYKTYFDTNHEFEVIKKYEEGFSQKMGDEDALDKVILENWKTDYL